MSTIYISASEFETLSREGIQPGSDTYVIRDSTEHIQAIPAVDFSTTFTQQVSGIQVTDNNWLFLYVDQADAIASAGIAVSVQTGYGVAVADGGDYLGTITPTEAALFKAIGVTKIQSLDYRPYLSLAQQAALAGASIHLASFPNKSVKVAEYRAALASPAGYLGEGTFQISDSAANIETLSTDELRAFTDSDGDLNINAIDGPVIFNLAKAMVLENGCMTVTGPGGVTVTDTAGAIERLSAHEIEALGYCGVTAIQATDSTLILNLGQAVGAGDAGIALSAPSGQSVLVTGTAAAFEGLSADDIQGLHNSGLKQVYVTDARPVFNLAQLDALANARVQVVPSANATLTVTEYLTELASPGGFVPQPGDFYTLSDFGPLLETLTPAEIQGLPPQIGGIASISGSLVLTLDQALALEAASVPVTVPKDQTVTVVDSAARLQALSTAQLQALGALGIKAVAGNDAPPVFSAAQMSALGLGSVAVTAPPGSIQNDGTKTISGPAGDGMTFHITWDSSVASAPASFKSDVEEGFQFYANTYNDPVPLYYNVGFGEVNNGAMGSGALGQSVTSFDKYPVTYAELVAAMASHALSPAQTYALSALGSVAAADPTGGATVAISDAEAQALGLLPADATNAQMVDGNVGYADIYTFDYNPVPNQTPAANDFGFLGTVEHEISEVLGRASHIDGSGPGPGTTDTFAPIDLFRFKAPGVRQFSAQGVPGYFSIDNGVTNLGPNVGTNAPVAWNNHANGAGGDLADWADSAIYTPDSFNNGSDPGIVNPFTASDATLINVLGYNLATPVAGVTTVTLPPAADFLFFDGLDAQGVNALWVSDGTGAHTHELSGVNAIAGNLVTAQSIAALGNQIFFNGTDLHGDNGLWVSNGSVNGTFELTGIANAASAAQGGLSPTDLTVAQGKLWFQGKDATGANGLWVSNGTAAGTHLVVSGVSASDIVAYQGGIAFISADGGVWLSDGTAAGTHETSLTPGASLGVFDLPVAGGTTVPTSMFVASSGLNASDLFVGAKGELLLGGTYQYTTPGDPTPVVSQGLIALGTGLLSQTPPGPGGFANVGGVTYFEGMTYGTSVVRGDTFVGLEGAVDQTDGTTAGTVGTNFGGYDPTGLTNFNGTLVYAASPDLGVQPVAGSYGEYANFVGQAGSDLVIAPFYSASNTITTPDGLTLGYGGDALDISSPGYYYPFTTSELANEAQSNSNAFVGALTDMYNWYNAALDPTSIAAFGGVLYMSGLNAAGQRQLWSLAPGADGTFDDSLVSTHFINGGEATTRGLTASGTQVTGIAGAYAAGLNPTNITGIYTPPATATAITVGELLVDEAMFKINPASQIGSTYAVTDTAFDLEALTAQEITAGIAIGLTGMQSIDGSVTLNAAQAQAMVPLVTVQTPVGFYTGVVDTAAAIEAMSPTQLSELPEIGVSSLYAVDTALNFTVAQAIGLMNPVIISPDVSQIFAGSASVSGANVTDTAAAINALTAAQITELPAIGVTRIITNKGSIIFSVDQALATIPNLTMGSIVAGDIIVSGDAATIAGLTTAQVAGLAAAGFFSIVVTGGSLQLSLANALIIADAPMHVRLAPGASLTVADTPAAIEALTPQQIAALGAMGVSGMVTTNSGFIYSSVQQAQALEAASMTLSSAAGKYLIWQIQDSVAQIQTLTASQILALPAVHAINQITAFGGGAMTLSIDQVAALVTTSIGLGLISSGQITITATAAQLAATPAPVFTNLPFTSYPLAVTLDVTSATITLSVLQLQGLQSSGLIPGMMLPAGATVTIVDSAGALEALLASGTYVSQISGLPVQELAANDTSVALTVAEAEALELGQTAASQPIPIRVTALMGGVVTLRDTAAAIEGMPASELSALTSYGIGGVVVTDTSVVLTVAQALAIYDPVPISVPAGSSVTIADTESAIEALTPAEISGLASLGVTQIQVSGLTGAAPLTIDGGITLAVGGVVPAAQTITFNNTGGVLALADTPDMAGTIDGFSPPDSIDLTDIPYDAAGSATPEAGNILQVFENGGTYDLQLDPTQVFPTVPTFNLTPDSGTGSLLTVAEDPVTSYVSVSAGQTVDGAVVASGGEVEIGAGATSNRGTITGGTLLGDVGSVVNDTVIDSAGVLDLNSGLSGTGIITFGPVTAGSPGGTLAIADTSPLSATIVGFAPGDVIDLTGVYFDPSDQVTLLPGDTLQAVTTYGTLDFDLAPGGTYTADDFYLTNDPATGTDLGVFNTLVPRTLNWTGALGPDVATAGNWDDVTNGITSAPLPPGALDTAAFLSGGGLVSGTGAISAVTFGGDVPWTLGAGTHLGASGQITVGDVDAGLLTIHGGATLSTVADAVIGATNATAGSSLDLSGAGARLSVGGTLTVGQYAAGTLSVANGASVDAANLTEAGALGGAATVVVGTGGTLSVTGSLNIGALGPATLSVQGGTLTLANAPVFGPDARLIQNGGLIDPPTLDVTGAAFGGGGTLEATGSITNGATILAQAPDITGKETILTPALSSQDQAGGTSDIWNIDTGGTLVLDVNLVDSSQIFSFGGGGGVLEIGQGVQAAGRTEPQLAPYAALYHFNGQIDGYVTGEDAFFAQTTVAAGFAYNPGDSTIEVNDLVSGSPVGPEEGALTFTSAAEAAQMFADFTANVPVVRNGVTVASSPLQDIVIACFLEGTAITTVDGPRAVETLREGDEVVTVLGGPGRIVWTGRRTIDCTRHPRPDQVWPVCITKDAFEPGIPARDLYLSPDHAVFLHGVLVPVKLLVNGATIRPVERARVTYHHIELGHHDLVRSENLASETYLDTGNRHLFEISGQALLLHPDLATGQAGRLTRSCVPLVDRPDQTEPLWRALAERAEALGWASPAMSGGTDDPDLHLVTGTRRIDPISVNRDQFTFVLPPGGQEVRLVSRSATPRTARPWISDDRRLGVKVRRLTLRHGADWTEVTMDDPAMGPGWCAVEMDDGVPSRWTTGEALLPILGGGLLVLELAGTLRYQDQAVRAPAAAAMVAA